MQLQLVQTAQCRERRARFVDFHRSGSPDLRDRLVRRHLPLAKRIARRYSRRGIPFEDLYQVASLGLIHAVDRFDPARGVPFDAFAAPTIVGEVRRHFRDRAWDLNVPRRVQNLHLAVNSAIEALSSTLGRSPSIAEIAGAVGASSEAVVEAIEAGAAFTAGSLSAPSTRDGAEVSGIVQDLLGVDDPWLAGVEDRVVIERAIAELEPRQQLVIRLYYWDRHSQEVIALRLGISQMHVSRLLRSGVAGLREVLGIER